MAKKNTVPTIPTTPVISTPVANLSPAERAANRVIGGIEDVAPPAGRGGSGIAPVWKDALEPLGVGQSRTVTGIGEKSLMQSVMKTGKKHWPERKFKVWVDKKADENGGVEVLRVGRLEDKEITTPTTPVASTPVVESTETASPVAPEPVVQYTAENPPPGYYYDAATNTFQLIQQAQMQGV